MSWNISKINDYELCNSLNYFIFWNNFDMIRNECYNIDNKKVLPITTVRLIIYLVKITVQFPGWGGYFFVVLLPLEPIAYPRPNESISM